LLRVLTFPALYETLRLSTVFVGAFTGLYPEPELRRLVADFLPRELGFDPRSGHVGFVVKVVALGQVLSEYFT
jgi:hypothetical protein